MKVKNILAILAASALLFSCSKDDEMVYIPDDGPTNNGGNSGDNKDDEPVEDTSDTPAAVKFKSFRGMVMCGYQGWFNTQGDGANKGWTHYTATGFNRFAPGCCSIEYWPDMSEYTKAYDTQFKYPDGETAQIFSSYDYETADLHFKWMKEYGIDGAIIQRFKSAVENTSNPEPAIKVIENCIKAAEKYGVAIMLEYDLSGLSEKDDVQKFIDDWKMLNDRFHFTDPNKCPNYLWQNNKPLLGFYGIGLYKDTKTDTPAQYLKMFDNMLGRDGVPGALSYFAGTGYYWQDGRSASNSDAKDFAEWEPVYKRCAVISPWAVGRFSSMNAVDGKVTTIAKDAKWCDDNKIVYAPVAFPGFSWRNTQTKWNNGTPQFPKDEYDAIPRLAGKFFWYQIGTYINNSADAIFVAMFDEIDEGTAVFKCAKKDRTPLNSSSVNPDGKFLTYDEVEDNGYYMFLCGEAHKWLNGSKGYNRAAPPSM